MINEIKKHLTEEILPFWKKLEDTEWGGFYGLTDHEMQTDKDADKGVILHSRILWFFSNAYMTLSDREDLYYADRAFEFLSSKCVDKELGGVYWSVTRRGEPADTTKHTYNQAFAIYALSAYYQASGNRESLDLAYRIFDVIEHKCSDGDGYLEAFDKSFRPTGNDKLSENGVEAGRTMNTLLHVMEAYTELYRVGKNSEVLTRLRRVLDILEKKVYNRRLRRLEVFFDLDMHSLIDLHSYGHDIEASWLLDRALEVMGDPMLRARLSPISAALAEHVFERAFLEEYLFNECENGRDDKAVIWWVQAEAMVGFANAYEKSRGREYLEAVEKLWGFVKEHVIDRRSGEWFYRLDETLTPDKSKELAGPWKCPYHNGRMCFELLRRNIEAL